VFLAVQITSMTMIRMIENHAEQCGGIEVYSSIVQVISKLDRLIDIMNGTWENNRHVFKKCTNIHSPNHPHLDELLDVVRLFYRWKKEVGKEKELFIPETTFEDLCWMVFAVVGVAKEYLDKDESLVMLQKKSGSDVCENHFGNIRAQGAKPSAITAQQLTARGEAMRSNTFSGKSKRNTSHIPKRYRKDELNQPLERNKRPK
jgi:hypothetical protein